LRLLLAQGTLMLPAARIRIHRAIFTETNGSGQPLAMSVASTYSAARAWVRLAELPYPAVAGAEVTVGP
jgi:hypothetical protein